MNMYPGLVHIWTIMTFLGVASNDLIVHFPYTYILNIYFLWSACSCLFTRKRKWGPLRKKKIIDHHGKKNGVSPISRLTREACEKDTLYLPLVPQHAQIKSSLKGRENIISIAFSSATWKGNRDPVLDQFKLCPFGRLLLGPGNCKSEEWKIKENEKKIMLCVSIHYFFEVQFVVCCHGTTFKECMEYLKNKVKKQPALSCYSLQIFWHSK